MLERGDIYGVFEVVCVGPRFVLYRAHSQRTRTWRCLLSEFNEWAETRAYREFCRSRGRRFKEQ